GRQFLLHKFRTLRPPCDWRGDKLSEEQRLSWIGRLMRKARLAELPQLPNGPVGPTALIWARSLPPPDPPPTADALLVGRPGMTGWAQVNGGTLLSAREKEALDEWYIRHASPWLDLRIIAMTAASLIRGDRRREDALAQALRVQSAPPAAPKSAMPESSRSPLSVPVVRP